MAPPSADVDVATSSPLPAINVKGARSASRLAEPLAYSGSLESYEHFDVTSVIGREFPKLQISEILHDDTKIRDLAILGRCSLVPELSKPLPPRERSDMQFQYPSAELSSSATRTSTSRTRRYWVRSLGSLPESRNHHFSIAMPSPTAREVLPSMRTASLTMRSP